MGIYEEIAKWLTGELSSEQQMRFNNRLEIDSEFKSLVDRLSSDWSMLSKLTEIPDLPDIDNEWNTLKKNLK
jgi:hypothetical protein